jgi:SepF-like predicted cell division protein (DUF552 family)
MDTLFWIFVLGLWIGIGLGYFICYLQNKNKQYEKEYEDLKLSKFELPKITREQIIKVNKKRIEDYNKFQDTLNEISSGDNK